MNLDDINTFPALDPQGMLAHIDGLPNQLQQAWEISRTLPLQDSQGIRQVLVAGMGGSAIGASLLEAYIAPQCRIPVTVYRNYDLPAWVAGPETLVIASSHSGNTEETLSAFEAARQRGCKLMAVSTGGDLANKAEGIGAPVWRFEHYGQPRAAVGFSFGLLLGICARLGLIADPSEEVADAIRAMREQQETIGVGSPVERNSAKRMAGQLYGRLPVIFGADHLEPVARRWKGQLSEIAKSCAAYEVLPEGDHNTLAGALNPESTLGQVMMVFLRANGYHPSNLLRTNLTKKVFMLEGLNTDFVDATGETRLAQQWTALHFGDYTAYFLAMAYGIDPTPIDTIESFKGEMLRA